MWISFTLFFFLHCNTDLNFWFFLNVVLVFLCGLLQSSHLVRLFSFPPLLLSPLPTLFVAQTLALKLPPPPLFFPFLPDSLNIRKGGIKPVSNTQPWISQCKSTFTCLFLRKSSRGVVFLARKNKTFNRSDVCHPTIRRDAFKACKLCFAAVLWSYPIPFITVVVVEKSLGQTFKLLWPCLELLQQGFSCGCQLLFITVIIIKKLLIIRIWHKCKHIKKHEHKMSLFFFFI